MQAARGPQACISGAFGDSYLPGLHLDISYLAECKPARTLKSQNLYLAEFREQEDTFAEAGETPTAALAVQLQKILRRGYQSARALASRKVNIDLSSGCLSGCLRMNSWGLTPLKQVLK